MKKDRILYKVQKVYRLAADKEGDADKKEVWNSIKSNFKLDGKWVVLV